MQTDVHIETGYFDHESGTKFYEIVTITKDAEVHLMITRWGKVGTQGQIKVTECKSARRAEELAWETRQSKENRGYRLSTSRHGLHVNNLGSWNLNALERAILVHYGHDGGRVLDYLKVSRLATSNVIVDEAANVVTEEPKPEPERGEGWGSW